jgi:hypothetical protein
VGGRRRLKPPHLTARGLLAHSGCGSVAIQLTDVLKHTHRCCLWRFHVSWLVSREPSAPAAARLRDHLYRDPPQGPHHRHRQFFSGLWHLAAKLSDAPPKRSFKQAHGVTRSFASRFRAAFASCVRRAWGAPEARDFSGSWAGSVPMRSSTSMARSARNRSGDGSDADLDSFFRNDSNRRETSGDVWGCPYH